MLIQENISLAPLTTFRIGGLAKYFCEIKDKEELKEVFLFAKDKKLPIFVLGGGSNVLISDKGFEGLVIKNGIKGIEYTANNQLVRVGAGESWDSFVEDSVLKGFSGVENLSGIPGSVGAGPVQNIGAYGSEIKDTVESVEAFDLKKGEEKKFSNQECLFGYRDSFFKSKKGGDFLITNVIFKLSQKQKPNIGYKDLKEYFEKKKNKNPSTKEIRDAVLEIRAHKMPKMDTLGTAGSFFKNPVITRKHFEILRKAFPLIPGHNTEDDMVKVPLAWILDNVLGLRGYEKDGVRLFENQPLIVVAKTGTKAQSVIELSEEIEKKVFEKTGIKIEKEVQII